VSHDPVDVQALCDDVVALDHGRAIACGAPRAVLTDPRVFPLARREGFRNVLPCRPLEADPQHCVVELGPAAAPLRLSVLPVEGAGEAGFVSFAAHDVLLAAARPSGLSARNVFAARVLELRAIAPLTLALLELSPSLPPIAVELTESACRDLALAPGSEVFAILKATSCRLLG